jgi:hypothetical protein
MTNKLIIAKTSGRSIRCTGRLSCCCGAPIQANDLDLLEDAIGGEITGMMLVCPRCYCDLIEVGQ